jgi:YbbR domain-containing protein
MRWLNNIPTKLLAIFLAIVVWFFVSAPRRERASERTFAAPLAFVGMPRDMAITSAVPDNVSVRLRGRASDLRSLSSQNLELTVDLSWAQPGEALITLKPQALNVPPEIEVLSIDPSRVGFRVEPIRQKVVAIRPFLVGQPPPVYLVGDPVVDPMQATISGPASQVRNISEVATDRIIMTGRTATFVQSVGLVADSSLVRIVEPAVAQVTVPVTQEIGPPAPVTAPSTGTLPDANNDSKARKDQ